MKVSKEALATDFLINLPVLKGHCQTLMTCALKDIRMPESFMARSFVIGGSTTGKPGEFQVDKYGCFDSETF